MERLDRRSQKVRKHSQETHNRNCKNCPRGLAALLWKTQQQACQFHRPSIHIYKVVWTPWGHPGLKQAKGMAKSGSLLLGMVRHQAGCLPCAGSSCSSFLGTWLPSLLLSGTHSASPQDYAMQGKALLQIGSFLISVISTLKCTPKPIWGNIALKNSKPETPGKSVIFKNNTCFKFSFYRKKQTAKGLDVCWLQKASSTLISSHKACVWLRGRQPQSQKRQPPPSCRTAG